MNKHLDSTGVASAARGGCVSRSDLIDVSDTINGARHLVEVVFMAAGSLPREEAAAIQAALHVATAELEEAKQALQSIIGQGGAE